MAISVDWGSKVINVPRADMTLIQASPEIRELDMNSFRLTLKDLEDDIEGIPFLDTHRHIAPITVGTVTLARIVEIINGYTVTFEDGQYSVDVVGANTNIGTEINKNQVSVFINNSTGLISVETMETRMAEMWKLHGLHDGTLEVSETSRTVKDDAAQTEIDQTITDDGTKTTVTRTV